MQLGMTAITLAHDAGELSELAAQLEADGLVRLDDAARRQLLLGQGVLAPGDGLDDRVNALEAGLREFVAFDKGCYVGQEVIARLENYDKLRRSISVVSGKGAAPEVMEELFCDGRSVGKILESQARDDDGFIAIALTDREVAQGSEVISDKKRAGTLHWIPATLAGC